MVTVHTGAVGSCREALPGLPTKLRVVWVLNADSTGKLITKLPNDQEEADPALGGEKGWRKASDWCVGQGVE